MALDVFPPIAGEARWRRLVRVIQAMAAAVAPQDEVGKFSLAVALIQCGRAMLVRMFGRGNAALYLYALADETAAPPSKDGGRR